MRPTTKLPVFLVTPQGQEGELLRALDAASLLHCRGTASDAAQSVSDGWVELVVCTRVPAWEALAARVETAGGAAVLWGEPLTDTERRQLGGADIEAVSNASELPEALGRAAERIHRRRRAAPDADALVERARRAELVSRFAQSIAVQMDLSHVLEEASARTRDLCDADHASLLLVDPGTGALAGQTVAISPPGIAQHVAHRAQPVLVPAVGASEWRATAGAPSDDLGGGFRAGSVIAVPMLLAGDILGVIEAVRGDDRPAFEQSHLRRLQELAPHAAIAVHNARMTAGLRTVQAQVLHDNAELERRIAERTRQIARAKQEWERTFDAIDEPIAVQDGFTIRRANRAYALRAGVPITRIPGQTCHRVLAGRDTPCPGCPLLRSKEERGTGELAVGNTTFHLMSFWLSAPGEPRAAVIHYRDVTEERALAARLRAAEGMAAIGQLASGAAHEINNPIGFLISNLQVLDGNLEELSGAENLPPAEATELLGHSRQIVEQSLSGANRVAAIVRGLRELSRQKLSRPSRASINASITRVVRAELEPAKVPVHLDLGEDDKASVDPLELDQALTHMVRNARQAVQPGQAVRIRTRPEGDQMVVQLQDEGCGMDTATVRRIFEPFFTTRAVGEGVGLGLTAAWGIIQRHGGTIDVSSAPGQGSTFTIRLPRAAGSDAQSAIELQ